MDSIVELPGLVTPIIVTKESESKYKVLEGNTRLHIYHELKRRKIPGNWDFIDAQIHPKSDDDKINHAVRLMSHLIGAKSGPPLQRQLIFMT